MTTEVYQTILQDAEAITTAMTDLYVACCNGDVKKVAAYTVQYVGRLAESIKDYLTDLTFDDSDDGDGKKETDAEDAQARAEMYYGETLAEVNERRGFPREE
jgi:hypothetical protein